MKKKAKNKKLIIGICISIVLIGGISAYLFLSGKIKFGASTTLPELSNTVYGNYTSPQGNGEVISNEIKIQIDSNTAQ